jgi:hypothetical protein
VADKENPPKEGGGGGWKGWVLKMMRIEGGEEGGNEAGLALR